MTQVHNFRTRTQARAGDDQIPCAPLRQRIVTSLMVGGFMVIWCICWIASWGTMWEHEEKREDGSPNIDEY